MNLKIVNPTDVVYEGEVSSITLPGTLGQLTILPGHTFLVTSLKPGKIAFHTPQGDNVVTISGGFAEVNQNQVTVVAN